MLRFARLAPVAVFASLSLVIAPRPASACGGCFAPTGQPSVVTAHRMVVSLSADQTTLWDQFEYAGDPEDFVWVLPVDGEQEVQVELAEQTFFRWLQARTQVTLQGPATGGGGGSGFGCGDAGDFAAGGGMGSPRVTVYNSEVVGPYETVTIGSEDAGALIAWLQDNSYAVPDELQPTIMHYVDLGMNFVVLRLSPGAGVQQIQPVRVTTQGMHVTFPLRMIAAGVADEVSLELYVISEGRYEAQNFPNDQMNESEITFDTGSNTFDYDEVADGKLAADGRRTWLTEFATAIGETNPTFFDPVTGAQQTFEDDWSTATATLSPSPWITRMRAVLPVEALGEDLILQASDKGQRSGFYSITNTVGRSGTPALITLGSGEPSQLPWYLLIAGLAAAAIVLRRKEATVSPRLR